MKNNTNEAARRHYDLKGSALGTAAAMAMGEVTLNSNDVAVDRSG